MRLTSIENHYIKIIFIVFISPKKGNIHATQPLWMKNILPKMKTTKYS
jgi:hypothetical protein